MTDRVLMLLNNQWAIGYDSLQWMIMRRNGRNKARGTIRWRPVKFICGRDILLRFIDEMKIEMMPGCREAIAAFPETHAKWHRLFDGEGRHIEVGEIDVVEPGPET